MLNWFKGILMLFLMAILWVACEPEEEEPDPEPALPPITQHGANTLGCYVNGKLWLPRGTYKFPEARAIYEPRIEGSDPDYWYSLQLTSNRKKYYDALEGAIIMGHNQIRDTGRYNLFRSIPTEVEGVARYDNHTTGGRYESFPGPNNWLHIHKLDIYNRIISGTFQYDAVNEEDPTDTVKIRDGRFDIRFTY